MTSFLRKVRKDFPFYLQSLNLTIAGYKEYHTDRVYMARMGDWRENKDLEIPLDSVNAIHFGQRIWERALGLGDLKVDSASVEGVSEFENIRKPNRVQNEIYLQMESNENRKFDRVSQGINTTMAAPAPAPSQPSITEQIEKLSELRDRGVLAR